MTATTLSARRSSRGVRPIHGLTWVTWRQHRIALAGVFMALGGLGLLMLINGLAMHHAYTRLGLDTCGTLDGPSCQTQLSAFQQDYQLLADQLPHFLLILPGLIGVFIGAPLVARELESGTFRFAWTQGRSRVQWIVTKLVILAVLLAAMTAAFSVLFSWWYRPFDAINGRMSANGAYEISGLVFSARTLFGFTLGALLGLLIRRSVPAMAATAAAWFAVAVPSMIYLRPLIQTPITTIGHPGKGAIASSHVPFNANVLHSWIQDPSGRHVSNDDVFQQAIVGNGGRIPTPDQFEAWTAQHHYSQWVSYQPNSWFWHFQTLEASGYAILALLLAAGTVLILRRRAV
ncbi:MAG: hypothetical protein QOG99_532 [Frankiales bacterium]|nr:hypothetical protein [Frankiales bacterium]